MMTETITAERLFFKEKKKKQAMNVLKMRLFCFPRFTGCLLVSRSLPCDQIGHGRSELTMRNGSGTNAIN